MLDENKFIEEVWKKYEIETKARKKDEFYEKKQYKMSNNKLLLKTVASFLLAITVTASAIGGTYAVVQNYIEEKVEQEKGSIIGRQYKDFNEEMAYVEEDRLYYGVVRTYEEYTKYKDDRWIEMSKEDFDKYFLIVIAGENPDRIGLSIRDVKVAEDKLIVEVDRDPTHENENPTVFGKIEKEKYRDNIEVKLNYDQPNMEGYIDIDEFSEDYTAEKAAKDGYVALKRNKFISGEKELNDFVERTRNGENLCIRVVNNFNEDNLEIMDIEYKDGLYISCKYIIKCSEPEYNGTKEYFAGDKIEIHKTKEDTTYMIYNTKEYASQEFICIEQNIEF